MSSFESPQTFLKTIDFRELLPVLIQPLVYFQRQQQQQQYWQRPRAVRLLVVVVAELGFAKHSLERLGLRARKQVLRPRTSGPERKDVQKLLNELKEIHRQDLQ